MRCCFPFRSTIFGDAAVSVNAALYTDRITHSCSEEWVGDVLADRATTLKTQTGKHNVWHTCAPKCGMKTCRNLRGDLASLCGARAVKKCSLRPAALWAVRIQRRLVLLCSFIDGASHVRLARRRIKNKCIVWRYKRMVYSFDLWLRMKCSCEWNS